MEAKTWCFEVKALVVRIARSDEGYEKESKTLLDMHMQLSGSQNSQPGGDLFFPWCWDHGTGAGLLVVIVETTPG